MPFIFVFKPVENEYKMNKAEYKLNKSDEDYDKILFMFIRALLLSGMLIWFKIFHRIHNIQYRSSHGLRTEEAVR